MTRVAVRVAGGSNGPGVLLPRSQGWLGAGQGACGRALIRCQTVTMSAAEGQLAWTSPAGADGHRGSAGRRRAGCVLLTELAAACLVHGTGYQ